MDKHKIIFTRQRHAKEGIVFLYMHSCEMDYRNTSVQPVPDDGGGGGGGGGKDTQGTFILARACGICGCPNVFAFRYLIFSDEFGRF